MTAHIDDGRLLGYLDGELTGPGATRLTEHLRECAACRRALEELRSASRRLTTVLERLDTAPPRSLRLPVVPLRSSAPSSERAPAGTTGRARTSGTGASSRRWWIAAALVLAAGTAAAAVPGSPVRAWVERSLGIADGNTPAVESPATELPVADGDGDETAVALRPEARLVIIIREPSADTRVRIRLVDDPRASVRASGARYRTARDRIEVLRPGPGPLEIAIPRALGSARVEVDGRVLVRKEGPDLRVLTPADSADSEIVFRLGVTPD